MLGGGGGELWTVTVTLVVVVCVCLESPITGISGPVNPDPDKTGIRRNVPHQVCPRQVFFWGGKGSVFD